MKDDYFVVIVDQASDSELDSIHAAIKRNSEAWWHHFENTWVVKGLSSTEWRDKLKGCLLGDPSSLLVLQLPANAEERHWSFSGPDAEARCEWLHVEI